jgi:hypothetical protein
MTTTGQIIIDPEAAIATLNKLDKDVKELRELLAGGWLILIALRKASRRIPALDIFGES